MLLRSGLSFRIWYNLLLMPDIRYRWPLWCVAKSAWSMSEYFLFRSCSESFHSLDWFFFYFVFFFVDIKASGIVFFLFFFSSVSCLIISIIFFNSCGFSFLILSLSFLSVIAHIYLEISNSSAEMVLKLHSFSNLISRLQKSSGFSSSDCFAQKNLLGCGKCFVSVKSIRYITGLGL